VIQETVNANDVSRFQQVRQSIANVVFQRSSPSSKNSAQRNAMATATSIPTAQFAPPITAYNHGASPYQQRGSHGTTMPVNGRPLNIPFTPSTTNITFHSSPFYRIEAAVSSLRTCEGMFGTVCYGNWGLRLTRVVPPQQWHSIETQSTYRSKSVIIHHS
jgi:hypothetical protein